MGDVALLSWPHAPATPVFVRVVDNEFQFQNIDEMRVEDGIVRLSAPETIPDPASLDEDEWVVMEVCTPEDFEEVQAAVIALGHDPAIVLKGFPNVDEY